jgi:hypothetical protein
MDNTVIIAIIVTVLVLAAIGVVGYRLLSQQRSRRLREQFGPEYERSVRHADDPREAEAELRQREKRHRGLELRALEPRQRDEFEQRWLRVQQEFVDDPGRAVRNADGLVVEVMSARGYPVVDFDQRAADLSVEHPETTQHYREARDIARANERGEAQTEQLRQAVGSYRSLLRELLEHTRDESDRPDGRGNGEHPESATVSSRTVTTKEQRR